MSNKKQQPAGIDIFTPLYEIFHEICILTADLVKEIVMFGFKKILNKKPSLSKIERKHLEVKKTTEIEDALGIDTKTRKEVLLKDIDFRRHSFIVGGSGFGKTNLISILQEHSLRENKPIIFVDPKGDIKALKTFQSICSKYKRECHIFSEHYKDSVSLNPLKEGTVNQVTDRIMRAFEWSEPYYKDASRRSLVKVLKKLKSKKQTFTINAILNGLLEIESKDNLGLITKLEAINDSDFAPILNADDKGLGFSQIRERNACLYIGLSTQGYGETATSIGKLFLGEFLYNSYKSLTDANDPDIGLKNPISIFFDEFGALVTPEFIELQNKCRGAGMELTMAVQTSSDIDRVNPDLTKQILENASNLFILKQRLDSSANLFSEAIGTILSKKKTFVIEEGVQQNTGSVREVNELLVHPDVIKNLRIGQCILLKQGPTELNLINIRNRNMDLARKIQKAESELGEILLS